LSLLLVFGGPVLKAAGNTATAWVASSDGQWTTPGNWNPQNSPDTSSENAQFGAKGSLADPVLSTSPTSPLTIGALRFAAKGWTLNGSGVLKLTKDTADGLGLDFSPSDDASVGQNTINVGLNVGGGATVNVGNRDTLWVNGPVNWSDSSPVYLAGGGTLVLAGAASNAPKWVVRGATLVLANNDALKKGFAYIQLGDQTTGNAESRLLTQGSPTIAKDIRICDASNVGGIEKLGSTSVDENSLFTGRIQLYNDLMLTSQSGGTNAVTVSGQIVEIGGARDITKIGTGRVRLSNSANTYSNGTYFNGGILAVDYDGSLGTGPLTFYGGTAEAWENTVTTSKSITVSPLGAVFTNRLTGGDDLHQNGWVLNGAVTGSGTITKRGNGLLELGGNNSAFGGTIVVSSDEAGGSGSRLRVSNNNALGDTAHGTIVGESAASTAAIQFGGGMNIPEPATLHGRGNRGGLGAMEMSGAAGTSSTWSGPVTLGSQSRVGVDQPGAQLVLAGPVGGPGSLVKVGSGTLVLRGVNDYAGATEVLAGQLRIDIAGAVPRRGELRIGPGTLVVLKAGLNASAAGDAPFAAVRAFPASSPSSVPEPATLALLGAAAFAGAVWRWQKRKRHWRRAPSRVD
jgi:autotransporter-associated beta strand protein